MTAQPLGKVLVLDTDFPALDVEAPCAAEQGLELVLIPPGQGLDDLPAELLSSVEAVQTQWSVVDTALMQRLPSLKVIARLGLGLDQVDVAGATERGIAVVNSGDYATEEVALHAIGLMISVVRRIPRADRAVRAGGWFDPAAFAGMPRLSELTLGLLGVGRIGARVARIATTLDMTVVAHDPFATSSDVELAPTLEELLSRADVLSLHAPLTPDTQGVIDKRALSAMRPGAILINTSRGGLVDQDALVEALAEGHLAGAGLDVFQEEPLPAGHPLTLDERVVLTPHAAYYSDVGAADARRRPIQGIAAVLTGRRPANQVNL